MANPSVWPAWPGDHSYLTELKPVRLRGKEFVGVWIDEMSDHSSKEQVRRMRQLESQMSHEEYSDKVVIPAIQRDFRGAYMEGMTADDSALGSWKCYMASGELALSLFVTPQRGAFAGWLQEPEDFIETGLKVEGVPIAIYRLPGCPAIESAQSEIRRGLNITIRFTIVAMDRVAPLLLSRAVSPEGAIEALKAIRNKMLPHFHRLTYFSALQANVVPTHANMDREFNAHLNRFRDAAIKSVGANVDFTIEKKIKSLVTYDDVTESFNPLRGTW